MGTTLYSCLLFWSMLNNIDPRVTEAVVEVESKGNPFAHGSLDDTGLMQIRKRYVPFSRLQLRQSCTNIMVGTQLLAKVKAACKKCKGKTWLNGYNLGISGARKLRHPEKFRYYRKIAKQMEGK